MDFVLQISFFRSECEKEDAVRADEHLDKLLPELTHFCNYVRDYVLNYMGKVPKKDNQVDYLETIFNPLPPLSLFITKAIVMSSQNHRPPQTVTSFIDDP